MQQLEMPEMSASLMHALSSACDAIGRKAIAKRLFYDLSQEAALIRLDHCLQEGRRERLEISQVETIIRESAEAGCHVVLSYLSAVGGYEQPKPVTRESQHAREVKEIHSMMKMLTRKLATLEAREGSK